MQPMIRLARTSDLEPLVDLETRNMHFPMGHRVREWFREDHPRYKPEMFAVAEVDGQIVSAAALLPRPVAYRGIDVAVSEWEAVVTEADFRRRGLCRQLFAFLEDRSDADLFFVHGLTWLYRNMGYFPALASNAGLDAGGFHIPVDEVPEPTFLVRPATDDDIGFLIKTRLAANHRYLVTARASPEEWRYALHPERTVVGPGGTTLNRWQEIRIIERDRQNGGERVGYFIHDPWDLACILELEIAGQGIDWADVGAAAICSATAFARKRAAKVVLPANHPLYRVYARALSQPFRAYGDWAVRMPQPIRWLKRVAAALEANLASSDMAGWSGVCSISRITDAFELHFDDGRLTDVRPSACDRADEADARFMPGRFEALAMGYRSLDAILREDADCNVKSPTHEWLLASLFPPGCSTFRFL